jgi:hypothetical protein
LGGHELHCGCPFVVRSLVGVVIAISTNSVGGYRSQQLASMA